jgi:quinolinate synthase
MSTTATLDRMTDLEAIYAKIRHSVPRFEWELLAPLVEEINRLKVEQDVVILGHNYMVPAIFHGISDVTGDSLALSYAARDASAKTIIFCGVHFMAETAKVLNPGKRVLIPDPLAGCSLSESMSAADVRGLREQHPGVPAVCYINTPAAVKAECDVVCTSGNAARVIASLGVPRVIFVPDEYLAANVARQTAVELITWPGRCIVHEQFSADQVQAYRRQYPGLTVLAHPECAPAVVAVADYTGSTAGMIAHLDRIASKRVLMVTECSMSDNVQAAHPQLEFIKPCSLCPHMKRITLENVLACLHGGGFEVELPTQVAQRALAALERMLAIGRQAE